MLYMCDCRGNAGESMSDELHHECGIASLYLLDKPKGKSGQASRALNDGNVTALMPSMLLDLQNRGRFDGA